MESIAFSEIDNRRAVDEGREVPKRFTSMPRYVFGAQLARAQGKPHNATRAVAKRKECAKGARIMAQEKRAWPHIHAVRRSGLCARSVVTISAIAAGGRAVNPSSSGDFMMSGRRKAPRNVTREKTTKEREPMRPISPRASLDCLTSWAASKRKYISPTKVEL